MSRDCNKDYIYLTWKDPRTNRKFIVAELSKEDNFKFRYIAEIKEAMKNGFQPLVSFDDITKTYTNTILFPIFSTRLPPRKRVDIDEILKKYGLTEYDAYELLKRSGTRLPIDNLEFVDPKKL